MITPAETRSAVISLGIRVKRKNAITALCTGGVLSLAAFRLWGGVELLPLRLAAGLLLGLVYANAFEYALHRFLLHWGEGLLVRRHALHHDSGGAPEEARYVNFATSPLVVVLVFALNALPVFALQRLWHAGLAVGMFGGFTIYYILYEEIHWRIHLGRLPVWLQFARHHHMMHHGGFEGRYNVFLPIFDFVFQSKEWKRQLISPR
jgi:hypothetical protein